MCYHHVLFCDCLERRCSWGTGAMMRAAGAVKTGASGLGIWLWFGGRTSVRKPASIRRRILTCFAPGQAPHQSRVSGCRCWRTG